MELKQLNYTRFSDNILALEDIFSMQEIPEIVFSDNASYLISENFKKIVKCYNFGYKTSSPRYAQHNGLIEHTVQTTEHILRKYYMDS